MSVSLTNMGMLATVRGDLSLAVERFVEAQALAEEVGDPGWWPSAATTSATPAVTWATWTLPRAISRRPSGAYDDRDDRWSVAHLLEDIALWLLARGPEGDAEAVSLLATAEQLREEIERRGSRPPRPPSRTPSRRRATAPPPTSWTAPLRGCGPRPWTAGPAAALLPAT